MLFNTVEELSQAGVGLLDVRFFKGPDFASTGTFDYRPVLRNKGRMLSPWFTHPPEVLHSWPVAYMRRLYERSSRISLFNIAKAAFISKLKACGYSSRYVEYISTHTHFVRPRWSAVRRSFRESKPSNSLWLVVPYHPLWVSNGLKGHVARHCNSALHRDLMMEAFESVEIPQIRVAWKLTTMPFGGSLIEW